MLRIIITLVLSQVFIKTLVSQTSFQTQLMELEYAAFKSNSDSACAHIRYEKTMLYLKNNVVTNDAYSEFKRTDYKLIKDSVSRRNFLWNGALVSFLNDETYQALFYFDKYGHITQDTSIEKQFLKFLISANYSQLYATENIQKLIQIDSSFSQLYCLLETQNYALKRKEFKKVIAYILPGFGLLLNGNYGKGVTSLALNTGTVFAVSWLLKQNLTFNAIAWGSNLIIKFYLGGINLTSKSVAIKEKNEQKKRANNCALLVNELFNKYPLHYKF